METLLAFAVAFVVTFFFVRSYVKRMSGGQAGADAAPPVKTVSCPRCEAAVPEGEKFCGKCGAPLELWRVHRADVAQPSSGDAAAPKGAPQPVINASLCIGCGTCVDACPEDGALVVTNGKAILDRPSACTGHAKCIDVCPTSAITLAFGGVLQTVKVPLVDENFETNVKGVFIVGELGGMGLIKTAINEGRLVIDYVKRDEAGAEPPPAAESSNGDYDFDDARPDESPAGSFDDSASPADVIIVGAGPAGLSAALTAKQHGLRYLAFDQTEVASTIKQYPRHKFLMAEPVSMPLYGALYIADGTKESLVSVWENIIANTGVEVRFPERVQNVRRRGDVLEVQTAKGIYFGRRVVLAMGKRGTPRRLGVPGEDLSKVAYRLIEAETIEDKDILIVGGGDSAIEASLALSRDRRNRVTLSYRKHDFSRARERNRQFLDDAENEGRLKIVRGSNLTSIGESVVELNTEQGAATLPNDYVFILAGGESPEGFLRQIGVEIVEKTVSQ